MDKITKIRVRNEEGEIKESIPLAVSATEIEIPDSAKSLAEIIEDSIYGSNEAIYYVPIGELDTAKIPKGDVVAIIEEYINLNGVLLTVDEVDKIDEAVLAYNQNGFAYINDEKIPFKFSIDEDGNYGYIKDGEIYPFKTFFEEIQTEEGFVPAIEEIIANYISEGDYALVTNGEWDSMKTNVETLTQNTTAYIDDQPIPFKFGIDELGRYGYYKAGADTLTPFNSGGGGGGGVIESNLAFGVEPPTDYKKIWCELDKAPEQISLAQIIPLSGFKNGDPVLSINDFGCVNIVDNLLYMRDKIVDLETGLIVDSNDVGVYSVYANGYFYDLNESLRTMLKKNDVGEIVSTITEHGMHYSYRAPAIQVGDYLYYIGGNSMGGGPRYQCSKFSLILEKNVKDIPFPTPIKGEPEGTMGMAAAAIDGIIYIFGGHSAYNMGEKMSSIFRLDTNTDTMMLLDTTLPEKMSGLGAVAVNGLIYLFGVDNYLYKFDPLTERFSKIDFYMSSKRESNEMTTCTYHNNKFYFYYNNISIVNTIDILAGLNSDCLYFEIGGDIPLNIYDNMDVVVSKAFLTDSAGQFKQDVHLKKYDPDVSGWVEFI